MNPDTLTQIQSLQTQVLFLTQQMQLMTEKINNQARGQDFEESVRSIVFFDQDSNSSSSFQSTFTAAPTPGVPLIYPKLPDMFLKVYFRGKVYELGAYNQR